jgi:prevent-host-death family protein
MSVVIFNGYNSHMKKASISELKDKLSALIDGVQRGTPLLIVDRGRPVARLEPVSGLIKSADPEGQLARLERAGVLRRGRRALAPEFLKRELPRAVRSSAVAALLEERREGR